MSIYEHHYTSGVGCDATGCGAEVKGAMVSRFDHRYARIAVSQGWTFWAGRSLRVYCPAHGPSRGSTMRDVSREWAK